MFFTAGLRTKRVAALDGKLKREPAERNSSTLKFTQNSIIIIQ